MSALTNWLISYRLRRLYVHRAGLIAAIRAHDDAGLVSPRSNRLLGEVEEKIRQLEKGNHV